MPRFHFRPFLFRTLSSPRTSSSKPDSSGSPSGDSSNGGVDNTDRAPSASSPNLTGKQRRPRKSSSLAKLRDKVRAQGHPQAIRDVPQDPAETAAGSPPPPAEAPNTPAAPRCAATEHSGSPKWCGLKQDRGSNEFGGATLHSAQSTPASSPAITEESRAQHNIERGPHPDLRLQIDHLPDNPQLIVEEATPETVGASSEGSPTRQSLDSHVRGAASGELTLVSSLEDLDAAAAKERYVHQLDHVHESPPAPRTHSLHLPSSDSTSSQSTASSTNAKLVEALNEAPARADRPQSRASSDTYPITVLSSYLSPSSPNMPAVVHRKIWVKRPGASATLVQIKEDDLVDDVRDMILRKYANSLGRTFDSPDMTLRIITRADHGGQRTERVLGPEEEMYRTIDSHYPGGQTVEEALIIDVPVKRTPRPSPRHYSYYTAMEDLRPQETGTDYFPPMPAVIPTLPHASVIPNVRDHMLPSDHPRSISVLSTGQVPPLPSPGGRRHRRDGEHRPKYVRQHTSSPTIITHASAPGAGGSVASNPPPASLHHRASNRPRVDSSASERNHGNSVPAPPPLPTPPAPEAPPTGRAGSTPPTPSVVAPPTGRRPPRKIRRPTPEKPTSKARGSMDAYGNMNGSSLVSSMLDGSVPPINVLIVEDNIINLRILEGLMKRLKVRWQTAMNGQIAVDKWKGGGYHLVLMDIQMPIMNGLQATKEIRRLERVNGIGVFSSSTPGSPNENGGEPNGTNGHHADDDVLPKADGLFKSPIIIVALTASSLQSDRHEALAAGCNDFLTKPVNFVWLERKVKEWGCMQALIDFDGWRKWKDYAAAEEAGKSEEQRKKERELEEKQKIKAEKLAKLQEKQRLRKEEEDRKKKEVAESVAKTATVLEDPREEAAAAAATG